MPIASLLTELVADFRRPAALWQAASIAAAIVLGWWLARMLRNAFVARRNGGLVPPMSQHSFARVLSPLLVLAFMAIARYTLARFQPVPMLRVALPLAASFAVIRIAFFLLRRIFARHSPVGAAILTFEKIFAILVWLGVALYITGMWPDILDFLDDTLIPLGKHKVSLAAILQAAVSVVILLMLALWAGAALEERLMGVQGVHSSLRVVLARMSRAILIVVSVLLSLSMVGIDLTVLSVFGGALGVGLGLGMQKIASNYVSGFVILLERSLAIGDMISVDKYSGKVTHINTRYTILQGLDGVETVLPNEMLISGPVQNQSLTSRKVRVATQLTVTYDSDLDIIIPLLEQQPVGVKRVLEDPAPGVSLLRFSPDGYDLELGFWIADPENGRGGVISDVNKKVFALVKQGDIKLASPGRDNQLLNAQIVSLLGERTAPQ
ncbi:MAG: mechanosensitive ion channel family protein [Gammaproteobacteria bacterium]